MCNAYTLSPKAGAGDALAAAVTAAIGGLPGPLIRRTDRGVVVIWQGERLEAATMRWGIARGFNQAINNARSDKLSSPAWAESLQHRRCLVPISIFYEWQLRPDGRKQSYAFQRPDGDWMWVAGVFENSSNYGPCYATLTTEAPPALAAIHQRILAVMNFASACDFLHAATPPPGPAADTLVAKPCPSPLKPPPAANQPGLF